MKFLLITKDYPPIPDASGRIVSNIAQCLVRCGHKVDVLARFPEQREPIEYDSGERVISFPYSYWEKKLRHFKSGKASFADKLSFKALAMLRKVLLALRIKSFPDSEPIVTKRMTALAKKLAEREGYDCAVAFFRPFSNLAVLGKLSDSFPTMTAVAYIFDLVEQSSRPGYMPVGLYNRLIEHGDRSVFESADAVVLPTAARNTKRALYREFSHKILYLEFPTFLPSNDSAVSAVDDGKLRFLYAGTLNTSYRNPVRLLELLDKLARLNDDRRIVLDVYGGGDCFDLMNSFEHADNLEIICHGPVDADTVGEAMKSAHVLVNIANSYKSLVPSKIFELFSKGKPVLNVSTNGDDGSFSYFERYPLAWTFHSERKINTKAASELEAFVAESIGKAVPKELLFEEFGEHTPERVVSTLLKRIEVLHDPCTK